VDAGQDEGDGDAAGRSEASADVAIGETETETETETGEASSGPDSNDAIDAGDGPVDSAPCPDAATRDTIVITALAPGKVSSCGIQLMDITFDYYPAGSCTPIRGLHDLDYAGQPLTQACAQALGLSVGTLCQYVKRQPQGTVEDFTGNPDSYGYCYASGGCGQDNLTPPSGPNHC
jgi:hypothetical protein